MGGLWAASGGLRPAAGLEAIARVAAGASKHSTSVLGDP